MLMQGAVANFVETEQLVFLEGGSLLASYTQVRHAKKGIHDSLHAGHIYIIPALCKA
jgi:hypothetical protein